MTPATDCQHCGNAHQGVCPRIRSIEYHQDGTIKKVEYYPQWPYAPYYPYTLPNYEGALLSGTGERTS